MMQVQICLNTYLSRNHRKRRSHAWRQYGGRKGGGGSGGSNGGTSGSGSSGGSGSRGDGSSGDGDGGSSGEYHTSKRQKRTAGPTPVASAPPPADQAPPTPKPPTAQPPPTTQSPPTTQPSPSTQSHATNQSAPTSPSTQSSPASNSPPPNQPTPAKQSPPTTQAVPHASSAPSVPAPHPSSQSGGAPPAQRAMPSTIMVANPHPLSHQSTGTHTSSMPSVATKPNQRTTQHHQPQQTSVPPDIQCAHPAMAPPSTTLSPPHHTDSKTCVSQPSHNAPKPGAPNPYPLVGSPPHIRKQAYAQPPHAQSAPTPYRPSNNIPIFTPSAKELETWNCVLDKHAMGAELLVHHNASNISLTRDKLMCMRPGEWLNDEVINVYFYMLQERDTRLRVHNQVRVHMAVTHHTMVHAVCDRHWITFIIIQHCKTCTTATWLSLTIQWCVCVCV